MIHDLKKQGLSDTAIGRQLGISRRTVARRLKQELAVPVYGPRAPKPRLIEPFEGYLQDRVRAWPDLSARRLFREIKERGYLGGYSMITAFLREVRPPSVQLYERRYETPPGGWFWVSVPFDVAEWRWGHRDVGTRISGISRLDQLGLLGFEMPKLSNATALRVKIPRSCLLRRTYG